MNKISVVITNPQRRIIWCNDNFLKMTGYGRSELLGKSPGKILQGKNSEKDVIAKLRNAFHNKKSVSGTITNYTKNGEAYPCTIAIHPIFDLENEEKLTGFVAFEIDGRKSKMTGSELLNIKYSNSSIPDVVKGFVIAGINRKIREEFYLKTVTIKELATAIKTNPRYLSQIIHEEFGEHYSTWINRFRVEKAKGLFHKGILDTLTFEGVASEVGFNSYSSFFSAFKTFEAKSPQNWVEDIVE